jgi:uncharacterized oxidoreductase
MNTSENTVLITGGATGIGFALAELLLHEGNQVVICGRREERLADAKRKQPGLATFRCDVADDAQRHALFEAVQISFPELNMLVNNAGIRRSIDLLEGEPALAEGDAEIQINLAAPIHLSALFIPHLVKQSPAAIMNITSGLGFVPLAELPIYCATKAALHSYTMSLRHQLAHTSVRVFEAVPPIVQSELAQDSDSERNRRAIPAAVCAEAIVKGLADDQYEIGIGFAEGLRTASRAEVEEHFRQMNR